MQIIELDSGSYEVHENFIIVRFTQEGDLGFNEAVQIRALLSEKFTGPFGLISDRDQTQRQSCHSRPITKGW